MDLPVKTLCSHSQLHCNLINKLNSDKCFCLCVCVCVTLREVHVRVRRAPIGGAANGGLVYSEPVDNVCAVACC